VTRLRAVALGVALLAVVMVAGCDAVTRQVVTPSAAPPTGSGPSGIAGRVVLGPTCAVEPAPSDEPAGEGSPTTGPTLDPDATPEPPPSDDPDATADPETTPFAPGCSRPYAATIAVTRSDDDAPVTRIETGQDGTFRVDLDPGDYTLVPQNGEPYPIAVPQDVTVVGGEYVEVEINYDSGIR
jgi:hypothetical protein